MATQPKTIGRAWCNGGSPEDGGWYFDETDVEISGYDMAYGISCRDDAVDLGVPEAVLDLFEKDGGEYDEKDGGEYDETGSNLFDWLQRHSELFYS